MIYDGIDTAAKLNATQAQILKRDGFAFVARYLVPEEGYTDWKALSAAEAKAIRDAGLYLMLCYETTAARVKGGANAGAEDGKAAKALAQKMGIPAGTIIYFAADYNVPASDFAAVDAYIRAARIACSPYSVGLYGPENVCEHVSSHCSNIWQCVAGSNIFIPAAKLRQYASQYDPRSKAVTEKIGVAVDLDAADTLEGMWQPSNVYDDDDGGIIYEYAAQAKKTMDDTLPALKWAKERGIITDDMTDCTQMAVILWRYNNLKETQ